MPSVLVLLSVHPCGGVMSHRAARHNGWPPLLVRYAFSTKIRELLTIWQKSMA